MDIRATGKKKQFDAESTSVVNVFFPLSLSPFRMEWPYLVSMRQMLQKKTRRPEDFEPGDDDRYIAAEDT